MTLPLMRESSLMQISDVIKVGKRQGTVVEKGTVLNEDWLEKNEPDLQKLFQQFSGYPDLLKQRQV